MMDTRTMRVLDIDRDGSVELTAATVDSIRIKVRQKTKREPHSMAEITISAAGARRIIEYLQWSVPSS